MSNSQSLLTSIVAISTLSDLSKNDMTVRIMEAYCKILNLTVFVDTNSLLQTVNLSYQSRFVSIACQLQMNVLEKCQSLSP